MFRTLVLLSFLAPVLASAPALACSCSGPDPETDLMVGDGIVPENAAGVLWYTTIERHFEVTPELVSVERIDPNDVLLTVGFSLTQIESNQYVIKPDDWAEGNVYLIQTDLGEEEYISAEKRFDLAEITVGKAIDVNQTGSISITSVITGPHTVESGASCSETFESDWVWTSFESESVWYDPRQLNFTTYVDGEVWGFRRSACSYIRPGGAEEGRGIEKLLAVCGKSKSHGALTHGKHDVFMEAKLPGTNIVFRTPTEQVDLPCKDRLPSVSDIDDQVGQDEPTSGSTDEGCGGCTSAGTEGRYAMLLLLALVFVVGRKTLTHRPS